VYPDLPNSINGRVESEGDHNLVETVLISTASEPRGRRRDVISSAMLREQSRLASCHSGRRGKDLPPLL